MDKITEFETVRTVTIVYGTQADKVYFNIKSLELLTVPSFYVKLLNSNGDFVLVNLYTITAMHIG